MARSRHRNTARRDRPAARHDSTPGTPARPGWRLPALLVVAGLLAFANSLTAPFVFDDQGSIVENTSIRQLWPPTKALWLGPIQSAVAGRPVVNLSLAINRAIAGTDPSGYRVFNIAVHILAALLLFGILRRTFLNGAGASASARLESRELRRTRRSLGEGGPPPRQTRSHRGARAYPEQDVAEGSTHLAYQPHPAYLPGVVAFTCALIWLVHPLQTEVIGYVTQRTESMMGMFYLLTLYAAIRSFEADGSRRRRWAAVAIAACALGMASKESMVTAPVMVLLYDVAFGAATLKRSRHISGAGLSGPPRGSFRQVLRERRWLYVGLAATWLVLLAVIWPGPRWRSAGFATEVTPWTYFANQPSMLVSYLRLALWPRGLVLDYGLPRSMTLGDALPHAAVIVVLLAATAVAWRYRRDVAFLGTWFFVVLAPTSSIVPIATEVGAERRMYLPLAAVVVLVVVAAWRLIASAVTSPAEAGHDERPAPARHYVRTEVRWRSWVMPLTVAIVFCALTSLTLQRNAEYRSSVGIWQTVVSRHPHGRAHHNFGVALADAGRKDEAAVHYRQALADDFLDAHYAIGFDLQSRGEYSGAIGHYREYIRLRPNDENVPRAYHQLGRALMSENKLDEALAAFRRMLDMQPWSIDARGGIADVLLKQEKFAEAIPAFKEYVQLRPGQAGAHMNLGIAMVALNREAEAVSEFSRAIALAPHDPAGFVNLGHALASLGRLEESIGHYKRATQLAPMNADIRSALGTALAAVGRKEEALAEFRRALEIDPDNAQIRDDLAVAMQR